MKNRSIIRPAAALLAILLLVSGCANPLLGQNDPADADVMAPAEGVGATVSTERSPGESSDPVYTCDDVAFERLSARPTHTVGISVVPSHFGEFPAVRLTDAGSGNVMIAPVDGSAGQNNVTFIVPVHPNVSREGGQAEARLIDDEGNECDPVTFTVEALPLAPGAFAEMVDLLGQAHAETGEVVGPVFDEVETTDAAAGNPLTKPLEIAEELLRGEQNENSLERVVEGEAPVTRGAAPEMQELMDALVAESGVNEAIAEYVSNVRRVERPDELTFHRKPPQPGSPKPLICRGPMYDPDAATLGYLLELHRAADAYVSGVRTVADPIGNLATVVSGVSLAVTMVAPNPLTASTAAWAGAVSTGISVGQLISDVTMNLLPAELVDLTFEREKWGYHEDEADLTGYWDNVQVTARSKGTNLDRHVFNMAISRVAGKAGKRFMQKHWSEAGVEDMTNFITQQFGKVMTHVAGPRDGASPDQGIVHIPACNFGPVELPDETYYTAEFDPVDGPARITGERAFEMVDVGKADLLIQVRRELFADHHISAREPVIVQPIEVLVVPDRHFGEPGMVAELAVHVLNADDPSIGFTFEPAGGHQVTDVQELGDGNFKVTVVTSSEADDFPTVLTVRSTSTSGLRGLPWAPPREATAVFRSGSDLDNSLVISPGEACVVAMDKQQFTAQVGGQDHAVKWSATSGSIDAKGLFTAPNTASEWVKIIAVSQSDPTLSATAEVHVGACACVGSVTLSPGGMMTRYVTQPGLIEPFTTHLVWNGQGKTAYVESMVFSFGEQGPGMFGAFLEQADADGADADPADFLGDALSVLLGALNKDLNSVTIVFGENGPRLGQTGQFRAEIVGRFDSLGKTEFGHGIRTDALLSGLTLHPGATLIRERSDNVQPEIAVYIDEFTPGDDPGEAFISGRIEGPIHVLLHEGEIADDVGHIRLTFQAFYDMKAPFGRKAPAPPAQTCSGYRG